MPEHEPFMPPVSSSREEVQEVTETETLEEEADIEAELAQFQIGLLEQYEALSADTPEARRTVSLLMDLCECGKITSVEQLRYYAHDIVIANEDKTYQHPNLNLSCEYAAYFHNGALVLFPRFFAGPQNAPDIANEPARLWQWQLHTLAHEIGESIQAPRERHGERIEYLDMEAYTQLQTTRDPEWNTPYVRAVYQSARNDGTDIALREYYREAGADDIARYLQSNSAETWRDLLIESLAPEKREALYSQMNDPAAMQDPGSELYRLTEYAQKVYAFLDSTLVAHRDEGSEKRSTISHEDVFWSETGGGFSHGTFGVGGTDTKIVEKIFDYIFLHAYGV